MIHNLPRASVTLVDAARCIYRANSSQRVTAVYERTGAGRLVLVTGIFFGDPKPGEVLIDHEHGLLRFGSPPYGQIECDTEVPPSSGGVANADQQTIIALLGDIKDLLHQIAGQAPTQRRRA